jgi:catalase
VLDATKIIPEEMVPIRKVGRLVLDRVVDNFFAETEQVAFCTQNIVPGVDFTNDPLLQGRNFSYLDTQVKRLGGPNFTHIPINAPKCPFHHFQQDGHMAIHAPKGRANYEPNSWGGAAGGPRESPEQGFVTAPVGEAGDKRRVRAELFADHYSQARQFYQSQTQVEQTHIKDAFVFELSKVETPAIRSRVVSHLLNVDEALANQVADGLGLDDLPMPADPARPVLQNLKESPALSIIANAKDTFAGRKLGVLVTNGSDAALLKALRQAVKAEGAMMELIAPKVGGFIDSNNNRHEAQQKINGGPSVLYDAVVVMPSADGAHMLTGEATARDFVSDAFAHAKFIGYVDAARPLFDKAGLTETDAGCIALSSTSDAKKFITACRKLRFWDREANVHAV